MWTTKFICCYSNDPCHHVIQACPYIWEHTPCPQRCLWCWAGKRWRERSLSQGYNHLPHCAEGNGDHWVRILNEGSWNNIIWTIHFRQWNQILVTFVYHISFKKSFAHFSISIIYVIIEPAIFYAGPFLLLKYSEIVHVTDALDYWLFSFSLIVYTLHVVVIVCHVICTEW